MNEIETKSPTNLTNTAILNFPPANSDQVFYDYDCQTKNYKFITPSVSKLFGYDINELNELKFEKLIISHYEEYKSKYPLNGKADGPQIEEELTVYQIETKNGERKWIEDNSITLFDTNNLKTTRMGLLCDVGEILREEKLKQIILEILEAANSEKNLSELFRFIHTCIKKFNDGR